MPDKTNFCYCCHKDKPLHKDGKVREFCKDCYDNYTTEERKQNQMKYVIEVITGDKS